MGLMPRGTLSFSLFPDSDIYCTGSIYTVAGNPENVTRVRNRHSAGLTEISAEAVLLKYYLSHNSKVSLTFSFTLCTGCICQYEIDFPEYQHSNNVTTVNVQIAMVHDLLDKLLQSASGYLDCRPQVTLLLQGNSLELK